MNMVSLKQTCNQIQEISCVLNKPMEHVAIEGWARTWTQNTLRYVMSTTQLVLVDSCWASKREFCRTVAIFPQVDDLRFINPWEV